MVLLLTACHGVLAKYTRLFAQDKNTKPQKFFRILNEVPTVLMIIIVIAVIVKPF
jgi:putative membrane protein